MLQAFVLHLQCLLHKKGKVAFYKKFVCCFHFRDTLPFLQDNYCSLASQHNKSTWNDVYSSSSKEKRSMMAKIRQVLIFKEKKNIVVWTFAKQNFNKKGPQTFRDVKILSTFFLAKKKSIKEKIFWPVLKKCASWIKRSNLFWPWRFFFNLLCQNRSVAPNTVFIRKGFFYLLDCTTTNSECSPIKAKFRSWAFTCGNIRLTSSYYYSFVWRFQKCMSMVVVAKSYKKVVRFWIFRKIRFLNFRF